MVATGVSMVMASGLVWATPPLTKVNTPCTTDRASDASAAGLPGS